MIYLLDSFYDILYPVQHGNNATSKGWQTMKTLIGLLATIFAMILLTKVLTPLERATDFELYGHGGYESCNCVNTSQR